MQQVSVPVSSCCLLLLPTFSIALGTVLTVGGAPSTCAQVHRGIRVQPGDPGATELHGSSITRAKGVRASSSPV